MSSGEQASRLNGEATGGAFFASEMLADLKAGEDPASAAAAWLETLSRVLPAMRQGIVVLSQPGGALQPAATWPSRSTPGRRLMSATDAAVRGGRLVVETVPARGDEGEAVVLGYPLTVGGRMRGAVTVELAQDGGLDLPLAIDQLAWATGWLDSLLRRRGGASGDQLATAVDILTGALHHRRFREAATAAVTELASALGCERVAIGFLKGRHVRLAALSNSANFGKKANLVRGLEAAMDEAVDQRAVIASPPVGERDGDVTRAHLALNRDNGGGPVVTVPLSEGQKPIGALTLERPQGKPFDPATVKLVEEVAALLGPMLDVKRREDRWLGAKAADSARDGVRKLVGPRHVGLKLFVGSAVLVALFLAFAKGDYRVTADASLEGVVQRAVAAPIAGFLAEAGVRAGDVVREGQVLALLDERDLRFERLKWSSQRAKQEREYSEAMARHERAKALILRSQIDQADAQLALIDDQLGRLRIVAPFDGYVVAGDLSQALGAPVERGNVLFEIAPLDDYRVVLKVEERDVSGVQPGQTGELALNADPDVGHRFTVDKVTPISTAEEGMNYFRVEATLEGDPATGLRPGMQGIGKVTIDRRHLAWIWTHRIVHWVRMAVWSWWP